MRTQWTIIKRTRFQLFLVQQQQPAAFGGRRRLRCRCCCCWTRPRHGRQDRPRPDQAKASHNKQNGWPGCLAGLAASLALLPGCLAGLAGLAGLAAWLAWLVPPGVARSSLGRNLQNQIWGAWLKPFDFLYTPYMSFVLSGTGGCQGSFGDPPAPMGP